MSLGKREMTVVVIQTDDWSKVPSNVQKELSSSKVGSIIPRGYVADMSGDDVLMHFSYDSLKKKETYKKFSELSRAEKKKPAIGSMAHMVTKEAKVKLLTREASSFKFGYPVRSIMMQLENKVKQKAKVADEAQAIVDVVNKWGESEAKKVQKLLKKQPTKAFDEMLKLAKMFNGMPLASEYPAKVSELKKDKYFVHLYGLRRQYEKMMAQDKVSDSSKKYLLGKLTQFIEKAPENELLKKDAESMIQNL